MRILMLVLMSEGQPYDQFRAVWRRYMKSHPNIDCYFYMGNPNLASDYLLDDDTLWIRISNSLPDIFERTMRAFRYFVNMRPNIYRFLYRPNASCVVNFNRYYDLCKTFPTEKFCSAVVGGPSPGGEHPAKTFPSGSGYTLSFDLVKKFARDPDLKNIYIDDVSIGCYLEQWGIPITPAERYSFEMRYYSPEELANILNHYFHLRFRNDPRRDWDVSAMNIVVDSIYGKK